MKLVFCGTPEFAVPSLKAVLAAGHEVALVLTQPDRPAGRGMELQQSAVKKAAVEIGLPVEQPEKVRNNPELRAKLEAIQPDAIVVVAYGQLIPKWMLDLPRFGNLNVHGSLLPKYRGAAPIQWAVANGETETGVAIMRLDEGLDTGPVYVEKRVSLGPDTTSAELYPQLAEIGAEGLVETLAGLASGSIQATLQDDSLATLAPKLTREDGHIRPEVDNASRIYNLWRGFSPWPGVWTNLRGKRLILHKLREWKNMHPNAETMHASALYRAPGLLLLQAAENTTLILEEVQIEGKPRMSGERFAQDFQVSDGERVG